jgi:hypothetical protein
VGALVVARYGAGTARELKRRAAVAASAQEAADRAKLELAGEVWRAYQRGMPLSEIARWVELSKTTVWRLLEQARAA